jgi:hypothetical protein
MRDIDADEEPVPLSLLAFRLGFFSRYIWASQLTGTVTSLYRCAQHADSNDLLGRQDGRGRVLADILGLLDELNRDFSAEQGPKIAAMHNEIDGLISSRGRPSENQHRKLVEARARLRACTLWCPTYEQRQRMKLLADALLPIGHPYRSLYQLGVDLGGGEKELLLTGVTEAGALLSRIQRSIKDSLDRRDGCVAQIGVLQRIRDFRTTGEVFTVDFYEHVLGLPPDDQKERFVSVSPQDQPIELFEAVYRSIEREIENLQSPDVPVNARYLGLMFDVEQRDVLKRTGHSPAAKVRLRPLLKQLVIVLLTGGDKPSSIENLYAAWRAINHLMPRNASQLYTELSKLRKRLQRLGVTVENVRDDGYRLVASPSSDTQSS